MALIQKGELFLLIVTCLGLQELELI